MKYKFKINKKLIIFYFFFIFFSTNSYSDNYTSIFELEADNIQYENKEIITANGRAFAKDRHGKEIFADKIIYNKLKSTIKTYGNSVYIDKYKNKITSNTFNYDIINKKIEANNNVIYQDKNGNKFYFSNFIFYENSEKGFGVNMKGQLNDSSSLESSFAEIDNKNGFIKLSNNESVQKENFLKKIFSLFKKNKNTYTTCEISNKEIKNIDTLCPDWSISSTNTEHNSNKKMIYHKNAIVKIRNIPVFYTPYFSHPDPTVKRKSGFLTPSTKNFKNLGRTFKIPYFYEIDENTDITFTPIIYTDENSIFLAEFRKQNKNSSLVLDTSYSEGYKKLNKKDSSGETLNRTSGSRNHFFVNYINNFENNFFRFNELDINIQRISQKNYLNVNQINTNYLKQDISNLNNSVILNSYDGSQRLKISANIYENLSNDEPNTKYYYKIPQVEYNNFFRKLNQSISLSSLFSANNFNGDSKQLIQNNKISTSSAQKIIDAAGIGNEFITSINNVNVYNENISLLKDNVNSDSYFTLALDSYLPFYRLIENSEEILKPRVFTKYTTGKMSEKSTTGEILSYNQIYSLNRNNSETNPEVGTSLGYGVEYEKIKNNINNKSYYKNNFYIGQVLRKSELEKMADTSSLKQKASNIVGDINFWFDKNLYEEKKEEIKEKVNNKTDHNNEKNKISQKKKFLPDHNTGFSLNYNYNLNNNLNKILNQNLSALYSNKNNKFQVTYSETHDIGNYQGIRFKYERNFENNVNLLTGLTRNLENNYSESNYIELNYESDCLKFGISLSKKFYNNDDIKADNNLNLFVMLKPFGQPFAPDLTNLIND